MYVQVHEPTSPALSAVFLRILHKLYTLRHAHHWQLLETLIEQVVVCTSAVSEHERTTLSRCMQREAMHVRDRVLVAAAATVDTPPPPPAPPPLAPPPPPMLDTVDKSTVANTFAEQLALRSRTLHPVLQSNGTAVRSVACEQRAAETCMSQVSSTSQHTVLHTSDAQYTPQSRAKLKTLAWNKVSNIVNESRDNFWQRSANRFGDAQPPVDFDKLEELFSQQTNTSPTSTIERVNSAKDVMAAGERKIPILDAKRSLNVNIFLRQFRGFVVCECCCIRPFTVVSMTY